MSSSWFVFPDDDKCLRFRAPSEDNCGVISIEPAGDDEDSQVVLTTGEVNVEVSERTLAIKSFVAPTVHLQVLEQAISATAFTQTLESIMRGHGYTFSLRGAPTTSTPVVNKPGRFKPAIQSFQNQVEVMRNLHPQASVADDATPLDSSIQQWRRSAALAMGLSKQEYGRFGGMFKECITVACFSRRCFNEARAIMQELTMTKQKVNASVFSSCCGYSDEASLFDLLHRMAQGHFSRSEFKDQLKQEKSNHKTQDEVSRFWRRKADKLEQENLELKERVKKLESQLAAIQGTTIQAPVAVGRECNQIEVETEPVIRSRPEAEPGTSSRPDSFTAELVVQNTSETVYAFDESDIPPPPERKRRASYKVSYKPPTDSSEEVDDSIENPEWKRQKCDKSSSDVEQSEDSDLNAGFMESPERAASPTACFLTETQPTHKIKLPTVIEEKPLDELTDAPRSRRSRDRTNPSKQYKAGDKVQALFVNKGKEKWEKWCPCTVIAVLVNGAMYRVRFDEDGATRTLKTSSVKDL